MPHRRKNIGYLWAIENGATQIYEFNDLDTRKIDAIPSLSQLRFYTYNTTGEHHATSSYMGMVVHVHLLLFTPKVNCRSLTCIIVGFSQGHLYVTHTDSLDILKCGRVGILWSTFKANLHAHRLHVKCLHSH